MSKVFGQIFHLIIGKKDSPLFEDEKIFLDPAVSSYFRQNQHFK
jgi:hypothetical protein